MKMVGRSVFIDLSCSALLGTDAACKVSEVICSQWDISIKGFTYRLTVVPRFTHCENLKIGLDPIRDFQQDSRTILN
ncbi:hypothetical protein V554_06204 [Pseudomonas aeruginosa BWH053]|nr:hypothetical protein V561_05764 [Pseudomonas aeruginosa BWH060]EZO89398.1 hypothetical protein V554_06204 [Pseudomonas aeruginosa BWH053]